MQFCDHLPFGDLHLGRELGRGITGVVKEGLLGGQRVAVKMSDLTARHLDVPLLQQEVAVYEALASLQGDVVPRLVGYGWILKGAIYYVATELVKGVVLSRAVLGDAGEEADQKREARESLKRIHGAGVAHKDIWAENLIVRPAGACGRRLVFLDFGLSETSASATEKAADVYALHAVLQSLK